MSFLAVYLPVVEKSSADINNHESFMPVCMGNLPILFHERVNKYEISDSYPETRDNYLFIKTFITSEMVSFSS